MHSRQMDCLMSSQSAPTADYRIRAAEVSDISAMLDVQRAAMTELAAASYNPVQISALLRHNADQFHDLVHDRRALVLTKDFRVVACAAWCPGVEVKAELPTRGTAEVRSVYVHPDFARRGIARLLLLQVERRAREADVKTLTLLATLNAVPFYHRHGYVRSGAVDLQLHDVTLPGVRMVKTLTQKRNAA